MIGSAVFVARVPDLLSLNITAQALNALLLPLVAGWLIALASGHCLARCRARARRISRGADHWREHRVRHRHVGALDVLL